MLAKYKFVENGKEIAVRILEGQFDEVTLQYFRVQFGDVNEDGTRPMRFQYKIIDNPRLTPIEEKEFLPVAGDILVDCIEKQLEKNEVIYTNGTD